MVGICKQDIVEENFSLAPKFFPYLIYRRNQDSIENFNRLTILAYGLSQQLLFKYPKDQLGKLSLPEFKSKDLSYSMADREFAVKETAGWNSFSEYSRVSNLSLEQVEKLASQGKLGPVLRHPKTGKEVVFWPPEMQSKNLSELPKPGFWNVTIEEKITASALAKQDSEDLGNFEEIQKNYLLQAHSLGEPSQISDRAEEMLYKSCFLLEWTIFEVFIRSTVLELMKRHPSKIGTGNKSSKLVMSYEEIIEMTSKHPSADGIRQDLIQREIERMETGGESVQGLINFLKKEFRFKNDPYKAWYVMKGQRHTTHYNDLIEVKEVRNVLIHNGGVPHQSFFKMHPSVPVRDNSLVINAGYFCKAQLILRSIAFSVAESVDKELYVVD